MYDAPGAGIGIHCSGMASTPCASVGDTSATAISSAENLLVRFKVSPV